jgi:hypothetical protein
MPPVPLVLCLAAEARFAGIGAFRNLIVEKEMDVDVDALSPGAVAAWGREAKAAVARARKLATSSLDVPRSGSQSARAQRAAATPRTAAPAVAASQAPSLKLREVHSRAVDAVQSRKSAHEALDYVASRPAALAIREAVANLPAGSASGSTSSGKVKVPSTRRQIQVARGREQQGSASARMRGQPLDAKALLSNPAFEKLLERARREVPRRDAALGPSHPGTLDAMETLGELLTAHGETAEGAALIRKATSTRQALAKHHI